MSNQNLTDKSNDNHTYSSSNHNNPQNQNNHNSLLLAMDPPPLTGQRKGKQQQITMMQQHQQLQPQNNNYELSTESPFDPNPFIHHGHHLPTVTTMMTVPPPIEITTTIHNDSVTNNNSNNHNSNHNDTNSNNSTVYRQDNQYYHHSYQPLPQSQLQYHNSNDAKEQHGIISELLQPIQQQNEAQQLQDDNEEEEKDSQRSNNNHHQYQQHQNSYSDKNNIVNTLVGENNEINDDNINDSYNGLLYNSTYPQHQQHYQLHQPYFVDYHNRQQQRQQVREEEFILHHDHQQHYPQHNNHQQQYNIMTSTINATATTTTTTDTSEKQLKMTAEQAWNHRFQELKHFFEENGHSDVPQTYTKNKSLGKWVGKQREHYKTLMEAKKLEEKEEAERAKRRCHSYGVGDSFLIQPLRPNNPNLNIETTGMSNTNQPMSMPMPCEFNRAATRMNTENKSNTISKKKSPMTQERIDKLLSLNFKFIIGKGQYSAIHGTFTSSDRMIKAWEDKFRLLKQYKMIYGHVNVSIQHQQSDVHASDVDFESHRIDPNGSNDSHLAANTITYNQIKSLVRWLSHQKKKYKEVMEETVEIDQVLKDRFKRLTEIGVDLHDNYAQSINNITVGLNDSTDNDISNNHSKNVWYLRYKQLCEFKTKYGHTNVSTHNCESYTQLPRWVASQRELWKVRQRRLGDSHNIKKISLSDVKVELLQKLGFQFSIYDKTFHDRIKELQTYKEKHGHMEVKISENKSLHNWIHRQRGFFKNYMEGGLKKKQCMTSERIVLLEDIGFRWNYNFEDMDIEEEQKSASFNDVSHDQRNSKREVVDISTNVSGSSNDDEENIKNHATVMENSMVPINDGKRLLLKPEIMGQHKKGTKPHLWQENYDALVKFRATHDHCRVPGKYPSNPKLGSWVKLQREG